MISCEIGQMNCGGQSDGTQGTTISLDGDLEESPSTGASHFSCNSRAGPIGSAN